MQKFILGAAAALIALPLSAPLALAAGDGGGSSTPKCKSGQVYDTKKKECVVASLDQIEDEKTYEQGRKLALEGRYDDAILVLARAHDKTDARILNYLGYSHRKLGRVSVGLGYYREAVLADPTYAQVREYMGEALLQLGDVAAAQEQLLEIGRLCGTGCAEYSMLSAEIDKHLDARG